MLSFSAAISVAHRPAPLSVHMLWPACAEPVRTVLFSHGDKLCPSDYAPLLHAWAERGLAIAAPDHAGTTHGPLWRARVLDMHAVAERLPALAASRSCLWNAPFCLAGHSYGAHTVAVLRGARPALEVPENLALSSADCGLLLNPPGDGSQASLAPEWIERAPYLCLDRAGLRAPNLVLAGGRDISPITSSGWRWTLSSTQHGAMDLGVAGEGDHYLGGIATGRGTQDGALLLEITATTSDYLRRGPAWAPPSEPSRHITFIAHAGMRSSKGQPR